MALTKTNVHDAKLLQERMVYTIKHSGKLRKAVYNGYYRTGGARKMTHYSFTMCDTQREVFLKSPSCILKFNRLPRYDYLAKGKR